jgi:GTP-binding protein
LIYFKGTGRLVLVDMPGYGYAQAPKDKVAAWTDLIHRYLKGRANLARVYLLVDARHGLKSTDADVLATLDGAALSYQIVFTKSDQVAATELALRLTETATALTQHPAAYPELIATSSRTGAGVPELRAAIARLLAERAD